MVILYHLSDSQYYKITITIMKQTTPPANIIIGILYFALLPAAAYLLKLLCKSQPQTPTKFTPLNFRKALASPLIRSDLTPLSILAKSLLLKYTLLGAFRNPQKLYLLKQLFIASVLMVACIRINTITLWPVSLAIIFALLLLVTIDVLGVPLSFKTAVKVQEATNKIQAESGEILSEQSQPIQQNQTVSLKFLLVVAVFSLATLLMIANAMFSLFYSVSNLGTLNIGSVAIATLIDQCLFRVVLVSSILLAGQIITVLAKQTQQNDINAKAENYAIFQHKFFQKLCQEVLIDRMNQIYVEKGEPSDAEMGASPLKKKSVSPSKVPKAVYFEVDTLMNLEPTKRQQQVEEQFRTPIKEIELSQGENRSYILTSFEKDMFHQDKENAAENYNISKADPNQFFSAPRVFPRLDSEKDEMMEDGLVLIEDGLVLMDAGLNMGKMDRRVEKFTTTVDATFSPTKGRGRGKGKLGGVRAKRQLVITGSSPYLEYLPDMMRKKEKDLARKSTLPVHTDCTYSRKLL